MCIVQEVLEDDQRVTSPAPKLVESRLVFGDRAHLDWLELHLQLTRRGFDRLHHLRFVFVSWIPEHADTEGLRRGFAEKLQPLGTHLDRKSTRLNSSHLGISYA